MDLALRNATLVDGSGKARYRGDLGIAGGRIVAIGEVPGRAKEEIDVGGAVVAPGFIDVHTHYDAQARWDPMLSPSVYHGVTTVLAGNCGFTLAPLTGRKEDTDYLLGMLAQVEGMPLESLEAGVNPTWLSFGEYLGALDGTVAINAAFMVGHSTLRRYVMGERAVGHEASAEEIKAMCALLRRSLAEGGTGFSTTIGVPHTDQNGQPVPSRWATKEEMLTLAKVVSEFPGTWVEMVIGINAFTHDQYELATQLSVAAQRPLNWNVLVVAADRWETCENQLQLSDYAAERGGKVYNLCAATPTISLMNFRSGHLLNMFEGWDEVLRLPLGERARALADPKAREKMRLGVEKDTNQAIAGERRRVENFTLQAIRKGPNEQWNGRLVSDYAKAKGLSPLDALCDLAIEEDLWVSFFPPPRGDDPESWALRAKVWQDDRCIIGGSDAGAHLDMINTFAITTQLLGDGVRQRGLLTLEDAVRRITSLPAERFGLKDRGRLAVGAVADVVVFDPDTVDCGPMSMRNDLPEGQARVYAESVGVHHVIVGGVPVAHGNQSTGRLGGKILRSGRDTVTVPVGKAPASPALTPAE